MYFSVVSLLINSFVNEFRARSSFLIKPLRSRLRFSRIRKEQVEISERYKKKYTYIYKLEAAGISFAYIIVPKVYENKWPNSGAERAWKTQEKQEIIYRLKDLLRGLESKEVLFNFLTCKDSIPRFLALQIKYFCVVN